MLISRAFALLSLLGFRLILSAQTYGDLPLVIEPNLGQAPREVAYLARSSAGTVLLTNDSLLLQQSHVDAKRLLRFHGINGGCRPVATRPTGGVSNYLIGDSAQWKTNVPHYERVNYQQLYKGVDLVFYGHGRELEFDLTVHPGASPDIIQFDVGTFDAHIAAGEVVFNGTRNAARLRKPVAYQLVNGKRRRVQVAYTLRAGRLRLLLGDYDQTRDLVIDPVLDYSTYLGGSGNDEVRALAVSGQYAYVTGVTTSLNFPTHNRIMGHKADDDVFVTKLNKTGTQILYSTFIGGNGVDQSFGIAVDASGQAYITGFTDSGITSLAFPTTSSAYQRTAATDAAFLAKLSADGRSILYSTLLAGSMFQSGHGVAVDGAGNAYIAGVTTSTDFPTKGAVVQASFGGGSSDDFVAKFNTVASGTASLVYSTYLGGSGSEGAWAIAVDKAGGAYIASVSDSTDFPTTPNAFATQSKGDYDAAFTKIDQTAGVLEYSTYFGGSGTDVARAIAVDSDGNALIAGYTQSADLPASTGAFQTHLRGTLDAFVAKFSPALLGTASRIWASYLGGSGADAAYAIATDSSGRAYITGSAGSPDFPLRRAFQAVRRGNQDGFVTKFRADGSALLISSFLGSGGAGVEKGSAIALDASNNIYVGGVATGTTFPTTLGSFQRTYAGGSTDAFVTKIQSLCGTFTAERGVFFCSAPEVSTSPIRVVAETNDPVPVIRIQLYVDGKLFVSYRLTSIQAYVPAAPGTHRITVQATDAGDVTFKSTMYVTVQ